MFLPRGDEEKHAGDEEAEYRRPQHTLPFFGEKFPLKYEEDEKNNAGSDESYRYPAHFFPGGEGLSEVFHDQTPFCLFVNDLADFVEETIAYNLIKVKYSILA